MVHFKFKNFSDFRKAYFQLLAQKNADERLAAKYELLSPLFDILHNNKQCLRITESCHIADYQSNISEKLNTT
jgi:hypothetical protein